MSVDTFSEMFSKMKIVELSHVLEENIPVWPTHSRFMHNVWDSIDLGDESNNYQIIVHEHNGTHVDMPSHFVNEGPAKISAEAVDAECFMGPCVTLDFSDIGENGLVEKEDIIKWEGKNGQINPGDIVLINLGWAKYWGTKPDYEKFVINWPGVAKSAAEYFLEKKVKMVGVDTMSVDAFVSKGSPSHNTLLPNKILIAENLINLDKMPVRGYFIALPLRIKDGSGCPVRAIGVTEK